MRVFATIGVRPSVRLSRHRPPPRRGRSGPTLARHRPAWALALVLAAAGGGRAAAQVTAEVSVHFGAPCPAATKYDRWCLPGEAVIGRELFVPGGATRVLRVEVPPKRPISRIQLTVISRAVQCACALFDVRRGDRLVASVCQPYEKVPAGRGTFGAPQITSDFVTVTFTNQEPYIQEAFLRVYYLK